MNEFRSPANAAKTPFRPLSPKTPPKAPKEFTPPPPPRLNSPKPSKGRFRAFNGIFFLCLLLLTVACGGGSDSSTGGPSDSPGGGEPGEDPVEEGDPYRLTISGNIALMGPLSGSEVKIHRLDDLETPLESTRTSNMGGFSATLSDVSDDELLLVEISGGKDLDTNDNGRFDKSPADLKGALRGLAKARRLKEGRAIVSLLSDIGWQYAEHLIGEAHPEDLTAMLDELAKALVDPSADSGSLLEFNPLDPGPATETPFRLRTPAGKGRTRRHPAPGPVRRPSQRKNPPRPAQPHRLPPSRSPKPQIRPSPSPTLRKGGRLRGRGKNQPEGFRSLRRRSASLLPEGFDRRRRRLRRRGL